MTRELKCGRYEVLGPPIGEGAMGVVYRAQDTQLRRTVALKMVRSEFCGEPEFLRRLEGEAQAAAAISHPNIATIYDLVKCDGETFIVEEYVEGVSLRSRMERCPFTISEVRDIGIQLSEALSAAHDRGIVHRDMKPDNIFLTPTVGGPGRVKILDFGLAKPQRDLWAIPQAGGGMEETAPQTRSSGVVGTPNYMSPEQARGEGVDTRTDLYSLGLVLYEMTTGENPFAARWFPSTRDKILNQEAPSVRARNPKAPPELDRVLRKCLRKRREERHQTARELRADLVNIPPDQADPRARMPKWLARALFLLIQMGYVAMYGVALYHIQGIQPASVAAGIPYLAWPLMLCILLGLAVHLYFLAAVSLDYPDSGHLFHRLFPAVAILDVAWSASPLLLLEKLRGLVLAFASGLAFLPFSQRWLLYAVYAPGGGHTSAFVSPSSEYATDQR